MSAWQFLLDENIDPKVATYLQKADVSAVHVRDGIRATHERGRDCRRNLG